MSKSRGVILVMYDLSVKTGAERREVDRFRKNLIRQGYISLQKSVYVKLLRDMSNLKSEYAQIETISPSDGGNIQVLPMTMNQFRNMFTVTGAEFNMGFFSDDVIFV